jgi:hypothetical protein
MKRSDRIVVSTIGVAMVAALCLAGAARAGAAAAASAGSGARSAAEETGAGAEPALCDRRTGPRHAHCYLSVESATAPAQERGTDTTGSCAVDESTGYTPCNIQSAYGLTTASTKDGKGYLVAVVDPYDDPNIATDLDEFRTTYGLPPCTSATHCFRKVNQQGVAGSYPTPDTGSSEEISLDVEMVSATCPLCHILLVEANSNGFGDLGTAENEAVNLGAKVVSNSWGTGEFDGETGYDGYWNHPGVAVTFSSGDGAYQGGVQYPSASPYVTSVGGTQLAPASSTRGWTEAAWIGGGSPPTQGSGSGCSVYEPKPPWQHDTGCANRTTADVSALAADVLTYDSYNEPGWVFEFGTSVSAPIIAGIYGLAKNPANGSIAASAAYGAPAKDFHDISKGSEGSCSPAYLCKAVKGYDGPTGIGSPAGIGGFKVAASGRPTITGVSFSGSAADPTVTIAGSDLDPIPPGGSPEPCSTADPGEDYGSSGLWIDDMSQGWTAGQDGDCIGLVLSSWSSSQVVVTFGDTYGSYPPVQPGDSLSVEWQGTTFAGTLT